MIRHLRLAVACGFAALGLAGAALAQPVSGSTPGTPGSRPGQLTAEQAEAQSQAEFVQRMTPYIRASIQRLDTAWAGLNTYYDARHAADPSFPTLDQAARQYVATHSDELFDEMRRIGGSSMATELIQNMETSVDLGLNRGPIAEQSAAQHLDLMGNIGNAAFNAEALRTQQVMAYFMFTSIVMERMAYNQPGLPQQVIRDIDNAQEQLSYALNTRVTHVQQAQNTFNEALPAAAASMEAQGLFTRGFGSENYLYEENGYLVAISPSGSVTLAEGWNRTDGEDAEGSFIFPQEDGAISALTRRRVEEFIRAHFPGNVGVLAAAMAQIDAINRQLPGYNNLVGGEYSDTSTLRLINEVLVNGQLPQLTWRPSAWGSFLFDGGSLNVAQVAAIYAGYDPFNSGIAATSHAGQSLSGTATTAAFNPAGALSSAPNSLTAIATSPSAGGSVTPSSAGSITPDYHWGGGASALWNQMATNWGNGSAVWNTPAIEWGGGMSSAGSPGLSLAGGPFQSPLFADTTVNRHSGSNGFYTDIGYQRIADPTGRLGRLSTDAQLVGFVGDVSMAELLRVLRTSGLSGLDTLLAQPFNIILTWGAGANDVDLHLTGPLDGGGRFHIYYAQAGDLNGPPHAALIHDCICRNGSEVILLSQLNQGGVYRISAFDFGNQSPGSTELTSAAANLQLQIVRGGTAVSQGSGTTIEGGHVVFTATPTPGQAGNTWVGVEVDPQNGRIFLVDHTAVSTGGGADVQ